MYRFWNDIIAPCLEAAESKNIVEVGSDKGENTRNLLEYCRQHDGHLFSIDTAPQQAYYDVLATDTDNIITFYQDLSLNVLDKLPSYDTILLDGDHNWYTVYHELKMIASSTKPFPLVILHDIGWPYDRRDLFYDPTNIPTEYLPPIERKGIDPFTNELCEDGFNDQDGFWHSIAHHTPRTGVLTAIEDFLKEYRGEYRFINIPMNHGLGFIISEHEIHPKALINFLNSLETSKNVRNLIHNLGDMPDSHVAVAVARERKYLKAEYDNLHAEYDNLQAEYVNLQSKYKELPTIYENSASFRIGAKFVKFYWMIRTLLGFGKK